MSKFFTSWLPPYRSGPIHREQRKREFWHKANNWLVYTSRGLQLGDWE